MALINHPCLGGCGQIVSGNKQKCVACLARWAAADLNARGVTVSEAEVKNQILKEAFAGTWDKYEQTHPHS